MPIEILMPALSPTMTEGNLAKWLKKEGDHVESGEVVAEIETDKATMEVEAVDEGILGKIVVKAGSKGVAVNALIAVLQEEDDTKKDVEAMVAAHAKNKKPEVTVAGDKASSQAKPSSAPSTKVTPALATAVVPSFDTAVMQTKTDRSVKASPLAKRLAQENKMDLALIKGTGPKGRIVKEDIEAALMGGGGRVVRSDVLVREEQVSTMRQVIAERLVASKQHVPHFYLTMDCNLDRLLEVRADLNGEAPKDEQGNPLYKLSVNDLLIKASALALRAVPEANASWGESSIFIYENVDVSVAVAIDQGLITPIVKNADQKSVIAISNEMKSLAKRAKMGDLSPEEYQGGGFSLSNLGMYGVKQFNAIINPPQACILAVGQGEERVIVKEGEVTVATMMDLTLSCDHRVVDGSVGAQFLSKVKSYIEKPSLLLV